MKDCLVTKLNATVDDNSLKYYNSFQLEITPGIIKNLRMSNTYTWKAIKIIYTSNLTVVNCSDETTIVENGSTSTIFHVNVTNDSTENGYIQFLTNEINLVQVVREPFECAVKNINMNYCCTNQLRELYLKNIACIGDTKYLRENTTLQYIEIFGAGVTGKLSDFYNKLGLVRLDLYATQISGDLVDLVKAQIALGRISGSIGIGYTNGNAPLLFNGEHFNIGPSTTGSTALNWADNTITFLGQTVNL